ncbi:MAG: signal recognition particle subunit SRP19/SEC65 family protein [Candidatus Bathyarchaeia archaeon]
MRRRDRVIVWPVYIDSSKTRRDGRRIPLRLGVNSPKLSELMEAAEKLGLEPESNTEAAHPRTWWNRTGYILVKSGMAKSKLLVMLASKMAEIRLQNMEEPHKKRMELKR